MSRAETTATLYPGHVVMNVDARFGSASPATTWQRVWNRAGSAERCLPLVLPGGPASGIEASVWLRKEVGSSVKSSRQPLPQNE